MIRFRCASCQQKIKVREEDAGRGGECPKCRGPLETPKIEIPAARAGDAVEDFEPGDEVGEYRLEKLVGRGGFAQVWSARRDGGAAVALKIPHDTGSVRELLNEGIQLRRLNHPNIVRTIDINLRALPPHIVLEFVDGTPLNTLIKRNRASGELFPLSFVERIFLQILDGMEHAHRQTPPVVHADLKPHNVLVADQVARIVDFGLGREEQKLERILSTAVTVKSKRRLLGTEAYMAPEQKRGEAPEERTDIFALGLMLQELLCNEVYLGHTLPGELNPLALPFDAVVRRATAAYPSMRYPDIAAFRAAFQEALGVATGRSGRLPAAGAPPSTSTPPPVPGAPPPGSPPPPDIPEGGVEPLVALLRDPRVLIGAVVIGTIALAILLSLI